MFSTAQFVVYEVFPATSLIAAATSCVPIPKGRRKAQKTQRTVWLPRFAPSAPAKRLAHRGETSVLSG